MNDPTRNATGFVCCSIDNGVNLCASCHHSETKRYLNRFCDSALESKMVRDRIKLWYGMVALIVVALSK